MSLGAFCFQHAVVFFETSFYVGFYGGFRQFHSLIVFSRYNIFFCGTV